MTVYVAEINGRAIAACGKEDWHHDTGKGDQVWQTFSEP